MEGKSGSFSRSNSSSHGLYQSCCSWKASSFYLGMGQLVCCKVSYSDWSIFLRKDCVCPLLRMHRICNFYLNRLVKTGSRLNRIEWWNRTLAVIFRFLRLRGTFRGVLISLSEVEILDLPKINNCESTRQVFSLIKN